MRRVVALAAALVCACAPASASNGFQDDFDGPDGVIAAEGQVAGPWQVTSGTLVHQSGYGFTNSPVFRMASVDRDFDNVWITTRFAVDDLLANTTEYDGVHIWVGYQSQFELYAVSVDRRDGNMIIKKKCPGGPDPSNGGTYYDLTPPMGPAPIPYGEWQDVSVRMQDQPDGSVHITGWRGTFKVEATDTGIGCAPLRGGGVGIRGDNAEIRFSQVVVMGS